jgi:hypothetical protein
MKQPMINGKSPFLMGKSLTFMETDGGYIMAVNGG